MLNNRNLGSLQEKTKKRHVRARAKMNTIAREFLRYGQIIGTTGLTTHFLKGRWCFGSLGAVTGPPVSIPMNQFLARWQRVVISVLPGFDLVF